MFNSTHTLVGLAIARTGPDERVAYAVTTAVIASNLPDIDIVTELTGTGTYLNYHRGITHTFIGIPFLSLVLALAMWRFSGRFWRTFWLALGVMATHLVLDYANMYGLRPFSPFNTTWYYGDTLYIFDPYFDLVLLAGFLAGHYFKEARSTLAWISLLIVLGYFVIRVELRNEARDQLAGFTSTVSGFERSAVLPTLESPLQWTGIIETRDTVFSVNIDAQGGVGSEIARMPKGETTGMTRKAESTPSAAALLFFARFPVVRLEGTQSGYRVTFADFRFYRESTQSALAAQVLLDRSLNVVDDSLSFNRPFR